MTIAILLQNLRIGGIQRLAIDEANELHRRGHTVYVITFEPERKGDSMRSLLTVPDKNIIHIRYPRMRNVHGMRALIRTLLSLRPELLITHHWFANTVGRIAGLITGAPHMLSFEQTVDDRRKSAKQFFIDRILQYACRRVIAISEPIRSSLIAHGIKKERIGISIGIDFSRFSHANKSDEGNHFAYVGRLVRDKGVDTAIEALSKTAGATLRVVGEGPERERLIELVHKLGLDKRVTFKAFTQDAAILYKGFDCLILPSRREGFGLVIIEAFASGIPVIVSDVVAQNGVAISEVNALIAPHDDVDAFAKAMQRFMDDASLRTRLSNVPQTILEPFSIRAHIDRLISFACI